MKASIVIPCYNAAPFVEQAVASATAQTMDDLEVICVDDGSTDDTLTRLRQLAARDSRIHVLSQTNAGEGPARDAGRRRAQGTWLYFLDADDYMYPSLLEDAIARGEQTDADLVIFRTEELDAQTGEVRPFRWCFDVDWIGTDVFCPLEHPERIFNSFQNWVHNKLYRRAFVDAHELEFQPVRRSADLLFTCRALSEADRIALLDKTLHRYRVNNPNSALFTSDTSPLDFYEGFLALRGALERNGTWELFHDSYVNWAQEGVAMNLQRTRSLEGFRTIAEAMRSGGAQRLDLMGIPHDEAINPNRWERCEAIVSLPLDELLFFYLTYEKQWASELQTEMSRRCVDIECIRHSVSFRVGRALTALPRAARDRAGRG